MANYTFKRRIHNLTGIAENDVSSDWLTDSAREVISILPEDRASAAAEEILLPIYSKQLYIGENSIKFSELPSYPNNRIDRMFQEVEGKVVAIHGEDGIAASWGGEAWMMGEATLSVDINYTVFCNVDIIFHANLPGTAIVDGDYSSEIATSKIRILNVVRYDGTHWLPCRQIDSIMKGKAEIDSGYMEESTSTDPVYYLENNKVVVLPTPTGTYQLKLSRVVYPSIGSGEFNLPRFPDEFEHIVTLGACLKAKQYLIARAHEEEDLELATSHSNHLNLLRQDYQTALQIVTAGLTQGQAEKAKVE